MIIESCKKMFGEPENYYEAATVVDADYVIFSEQLPNESLLTELFEDIPERDDIEISMKDEEGVYFKSSHNATWMDEYTKFCDGRENGEEINIHIHIEKRILDDTVSIYNFKSFVETLEKEELLKQLDIFVAWMREREKGLRIVIDTTDVLITKYIVIASELRDITNGRVNDIQKCEDASIFMNRACIPLIPQDFSIQYCNGGISDRMAKIFKTVESFLALMYIVNTSNIVLDKAIIQMQPGQNFEIEANSYKYNCVITEVYNWVFADGESSIDRASIARNIINVRCKDGKALLNMDSSVLMSIKSNYMIYQKDTVQKYLELKDQISECISNTTLQFQDAIDGLIEGIRNNLIAIITFIVSLVLTDSLNLENLVEEQLPRNLQLVIGIFLIASAVYLFITRKTVNTKWELIVDRYNRLKQNYKDVLEAKDLDDAFGHDEMIHTYENKLNSYKKTITGIWIFFILLVAILAVIYSFDVGYWGRLLKQFLTQSK